MSSLRQGAEAGNVYISDVLSGKKLKRLFLYPDLDWLSHNSPHPVAVQSVWLLHHGIKVKMKSFTCS